MIFNLHLMYHDIFLLHRAPKKSGAWCSLLPRPSSSLDGSSLWPSVLQRNKSGPKERLLQRAPITPLPWWPLGQLKVLDLSMI